MAKKLGRGLSAILSDVEESYVRDISQDSNVVKELDINKIIPNPYQPRKIFDDESLKELAESIKNQGLIQPIIVTMDDDEYVLIAGERRLRAHQLLNKNTIKAIIIDFDLTKLREFAIIENLQREDLNVLDLATSLYELMQEHNYTHDDLAKILSKSRSYITNILRLLKLSPYAKEKLKENKINFGHAKSLVVLKEDIQNKLVDTIIGQKLTSREVEKLTKSYKNNKSEQTNHKEIKEEEVLDLANLVKKIQSKYNLKLQINDKNLIINVTSKKDLKKIRKIFDV